MTESKDAPVHAASQLGGWTDPDSTTCMVSASGKEPLVAMRIACSIAWETEVRRRVGEPLRLPSLSSLLIAVPGASGDVGLSTVLVRYVKDMNPSCHVTYATTAANVPIVKMCPGVDAVLEMPADRRLRQSRRSLLREYAGSAEAVIVPVCFPEDADLMLRYNLIETMWILAGARQDQIPPTMRPWLCAPLPSGGWQCVVARHLDWTRTARNALKALASSIIDDVRALAWCWVERSLRTPSLAGCCTTLRNIASLRVSCHSGGRLTDSACSRCVILATDANSIPGASPEVAESLCRSLRCAGWTVLHNVVSPLHAIKGAVPLTCSYTEFLQLRLLGVPFIAWRSGLCDLATAASAPMCVVYPAVRVYGRSPREAFGFREMGIGTNVLELECDSNGRLPVDAMLQHISEGR